MCPVTAARLRFELMKPQGGCFSAAGMGGDDVASLVERRGRRALRPRARGTEESFFTGLHRNMQKNKRSRSKCTLPATATFRSPPARLCSQQEWVS
ncbi:hypothetical protein SKAU_G00252620 [Synaphobranchus kaupii]|uniref:Uncharacterized protein n=1 Tax=Synaphobranchus kaupii TaxID=118154 RepID=A0A9Q1F3J3_SYNKA|nr:hypothetical protein SKAU_G00252620 [Synaphobranchus kaupii]